MHLAEVTDIPLVAKGNTRLSGDTLLFMQLLYTGCAPIGKIRKQLTKKANPKQIAMRPILIPGVTPLMFSSSPISTDHVLWNRSWCVMKGTAKGML